LLVAPYSGLQFFGEVNIDAYSAVMTVDLRDINGGSVFTRKLISRVW
jgi:alkaline phosphatase D